MPHSVICDLVHGEGSIQCASEDAMSQRQLLSRKLQPPTRTFFKRFFANTSYTVLTTYHQAWRSV
jgi:hypothetical protein